MKTIYAPTNQAAAIAELSSDSYHWMNGVKPEITTLGAIIKSHCSGHIYLVHWWHGKPSGFTRIVIAGEYQQGFWHMSTYNEEPRNYDMLVSQDCIVAFYPG